MFPSICVSIFVSSYTIFPSMVLDAGLASSNRLILVMKTPFLFHDIAVARCAHIRALSAFFVVLALLAHLGQMQRAF